jgi:hypothetical protein
MATDGNPGSAALRDSLRRASLVRDSAAAAVRDTVATVPRTTAPMTRADSLRAQARADSIRARTRADSLRRMRE